MKGYISTPGLERGTFDSPGLPPRGGEVLISASAVPNSRMAHATSLSFRLMRQTRRRSHHLENKQFSSYDSTTSRISSFRVNKEFSSQDPTISRISSFLIMIPPPGEKGVFLSWSHHFENKEFSSHEPITWRISSFRLMSPSPRK